MWSLFESQCTLAGSVNTVDVYVVLDLMYINNHLTRGLPVVSKKFTPDPIFLLCHRKPTEQPKENFKYMIVCFSTCYIFLLLLNVSINRFTNKFLRYFFSLNVMHDVAVERKFEYIHTYIHIKKHRITQYIVAVQVCKRCYSY